jgi:hypothetical protein
MGAVQDRAHAGTGLTGDPRRGACSGRNLIGYGALSGTLGSRPASNAPTRNRGPLHYESRAGCVLGGTGLHTNRWGRAYKQATQPLTVNIDANTRYVKADQPSTLDALAMNDQVAVKFKMSRCDLLKSANSPATPTAKMVVD